MLAFFKMILVGGNNGLTDFKDILGKDLSSKETRGVLFAYSALMLIIGYLICRKIISSKIGTILVGIRDKEDRMRFLGYNTTVYKINFYCICNNCRYSRSSICSSSWYNKPR